MTAITQYPSRGQPTGGTAGATNPSEAVRGDHEHRARVPEAIQGDLRRLATVQEQASGADGAGQDRAGSVNAQAAGATTATNGTCTQIPAPAAGILPSLLPKPAGKLAETASKPASKATATVLPPAVEQEQQQPHEPDPSDYVVPAPEGPIPPKPGGGCVCSNDLETSKIFRTSQPDSGNSTPQSNTLPVDLDALLVCEYSPTQHCFHIETVGEMISTNLRQILTNETNNYLPFYVCSTPEAANDACDFLQKTMLERGAKRDRFGRVWMPKKARQEDAEATL